MNHFAIASVLLLSFLIGCGPRHELRNATDWDAQSQLADDHHDLTRVTELRSGLASARESMDEQEFRGLEDQLKDYLKSELSESSWEIDHADEEQVQALKTHREKTYSIAKEFRGLAGKRDGESLDRADSLLGELIHLARTKLGVQRAWHAELQDGPNTPRKALDGP